MANSESFPTEINKQLADLEGEKKEKENAVERFLEVAGVEAAGGARGDEVGEEKPCGGDEEPHQRG